MVAMSGVMLANDSLESGWSGFAAVFGLGCGLVQLMAGLLAWVGSLSDWLPGQSLVKHMWVAEPMRVHGRRGMRLLMAAVAGGLGVLRACRRNSVRHGQDGHGGLARRGVGYAHPGRHGRGGMT